MVLYRSNFVASHFLWCAWLGVRFRARARVRARVKVKVGVRFRVC